MARDARYGIYFIPNENKNYEEEPIFIIRGKDAASPEAIRAYAQIAVANGASSDFLGSCYARSIDFEKWQERNRDIVKVPD